MTLTDISAKVPTSDDFPPVPDELEKVAEALTMDPQTAETIARITGTELSSVMIMLTRLEMEGFAKEVWPGSFVRRVNPVGSA